VRFLFLAFIVVPIVEMLVLIRVGSLFGAWATVGLVLLTAMIGISVLKVQGIGTLRRAQEKMQEGQIPAFEMLEGLCLAVAGAFLLTPGFVTDTLGFILLVPAFRSLIAGYFQRRSIGGASIDMSSHANFSAKAQSGPEKKSPVIEGEFKRED
jgi:UPF0716 protein FxsA